MTDALKQAMIECLKIYVRTKMARSTAHPSQNKICASHKPKTIIKKSAFEEMTIEEANEKLQKKITTERKRAPKKKK